MKIKELQTFNFRGLPGNRTFAFDTLNVILEKNATGKSSLIGALIYVLSGIEPEGDMINAATDSAGVQIEFEDGSKFSRIKSRKTGTTVLRIGKTKTTKKDFDVAIARACGVTAPVIRMCTSSDLVKAMKPAEMGDLFLSYIGETLSMDSLLNAISDGTCTDDMRTMAMHVAEKQGLPKHFGISTVDVLYRDFYEYRKKYNAESRDAKAVFQVYSDRAAGIPENTDPDAIRKEYETLKQTAGKAAAYKAETEAYRRAKTGYDLELDSIKQMDAQIAKIEAKERPDAERTEILERIAKEKEDIRTATQMIASLTSSKDLMERSFRNLDLPTCPLSDRLVCTTDKSACREELKVSIDSLTSQISVQRTVLDRHTAEEKNLNEKLMAFDQERAEYIRKTTLQAQRDRKQQHLGEPPKEPEKVDLEALNKAALRMGEIEDILKKMEAKAEADKACVLKDKKARAAAAFDGLVRAFSPKGIIKQKILEDYVKLFEDQCNRTAETLKPGMRFRLKAENGIVITVTFGDGIYLGYDSLSGGERAVMILAIMTMLNSLTGLRLIVMDEMSILDAESFGNVVKLLKETAGDRDHAVIAAVDHIDTQQVLEEQGIPVFEGLVQHTPKKPKARTRKRKPKEETDNE